MNGADFLTKKKTKKASPLVGTSILNFVLITKFRKGYQTFKSNGGLVCPFFLYHVEYQGLGPTIAITAAVENQSQTENERKEKSVLDRIQSAVSGIGKTSSKIRLPHTRCGDLLQPSF